MYEGAQLRYGWISGGKTAVPVPMYASERVDAPGGRFVNVRTDGYAEYIDDTDDVEIFGSVESPYGTHSTTSGRDVYNCIIDPSAVYRIPVHAGTYAITMLGDTCDIGVTTYVQGADLAAATYTHLVIVGGDVANNKYVDVILNPSERGQTTVV